MTEKLTIEATIPTVQYGNIKPTLELEGNDWEELRDKGLQRIKEISDMTAGEGYTFDVRGLSVNNVQSTVATLKTVQTAPTKLTSDITGVTLWLDKESHTYRDSNGKKYSSASKFPDNFYPKFMSKEILDAMVNAHPGVTAAEIMAMWKLNSEASTGYGTAIHAALENYDRNKKLGEVLRAADGPNKAFSKNPFLQHVVRSFQEGKEDEDVLPEVFVANEEFNICGRIDRLKFVDREKKIVRVQDYKTDGDIHEKKYQVASSPFKKSKKGQPENPNAVENSLVGYHRLQLSHLSFILQRAGYTVEGTDIFWLNPNKIITGENPWETFSSPVVDIMEGLMNG